MSGSFAGPADYQIAARIERLPISAWHARIGVVVCAGFFFDAFDIMTLAYALPVLVGRWHLAPGEIGTAISIGFIGQIFGALFFGWLAEKKGRVPSAVATVLLYALMSLACAFAWNLPSMMVMRFIQGWGIGGTIPVLATYINEFANSRRRGRFVLCYQCAFSIGLPMTAWIGNWVVPHLGWEWMFIIGALPALIVLPMARMLPESPRWLANHGRNEEANRVLARIEGIISHGGAKPLPPIPTGMPQVPRNDTHVGDLFRGIYLKRTLTVWTLWFCTYVITYGMLTWLPTIWRTVYHMSVEEALHYQSIYALIAAPGFIVTISLIDSIGRRRMFLLGLGVGAALMLALASLDNPAPMTLLLMLSMSQLAVGMLALALSTYTAELYPTELRALGGGFGNAWLRLGGTAGPAFIGAMLPVFGLKGIFASFGVLLAFGAVVCFLFAIETGGKVLEHLSPSLKRGPDEAASPKLAYGRE
ncbi:MAG TPA: MFS transporter [Stellaceae bacterium]|nr:MFS transporter [Stellaceae bacterium]